MSGRAGASLPSEVPGLCSPCGPYRARARPGHGPQPWWSVRAWGWELALGLARTRVCALACAPARCRPPSLSRSASGGCVLPSGVRLAGGEAIGAWCGVGGCPLPSSWRARLPEKGEDSLPLGSPADPDDSAEGLRWGAAATFAVSQTMVRSLRRGPPAVRPTWSCTQLEAELHPCPEPRRVFCFTFFVYW